MKEPKVLIVDDEDLLLELLAESFTKHEIQNEKANCFSVALEKLRESSYDLVLSDIRINDKAGIDILGFLEKIESESLMESKSIVLMSGYSDLDFKEVEKMGVAEIIAKPFMPRKIVPKLIKYLRHND